MSHNVKLERAREHIHALDCQIRAWVEGEPCCIVDEADPETPYQPLFNGDQARRFRVHSVSAIPPMWAAIIGDCVFNLRSALDHLAMALARKHTVSMTVDQIRRSEFPIFHKASAYTDAELKKIGCIDPAARAVIKRLQPYHGGDRHAVHPLWQMHEINCIDKHRTLTVCAVESMRNNARGVGYFPENVLVHDIQSSAIDLIPNTVIARWIGRPDDPNREMRMNPYATPEIIFGNGGPAAGEVVVPTLQALHDFVRDVAVTQLSQFL